MYMRSRQMHLLISIRFQLSITLPPTYNTYLLFIFFVHAYCKWGLFAGSIERRVLTSIECCFRCSYYYRHSLSLMGAFLRAVLRTRYSRRRAFDRYSSFLLRDGSQVCGPMGATSLTRRAPVHHITIHMSERAFRPFGLAGQCGDSTLHALIR